MDSRPHPSKSLTIESTWTDDSSNSDAIAPPGLWAMINAATRYEREDLVDDFSEDMDSTESTGTESPIQDEKPLDQLLSPVPIDASHSRLARLAQLSVTSYGGSPRAIPPESLEGPESPPSPDAIDADVILRLIQQEFGAIARD